KPDLEMFGQDLSIESRNSSVTSPVIKIVDIPSDVGQAKLLPTLLSDFEDDLTHGNPQKTAIILADENLMPAVLSSIPSYIEDVNITMGYPFSLTPVYSLLRSLLYIQQRYVRLDLKNYYDHKSVLSILNNPLVKRCAGDDAQKKAKEIVDGNKLYVQPSFFKENDFLTQIFSITSDAKALLQYMRDLFMKITIAFDVDGDEDAKVEDPLTVEFLYKANQLINRLEPLLEDETLVDKRVLSKLMDSIFREIKVPFNGEPLKGLQVMGILESRDLDFDNIIMLSANEGVLPKTSSGSSYIPFNLREAFGMPTIDHQDSIFSYYFTRLLTRAKKLTYVYNSSSDGLKTGEMSRFLLRLKYNSDVDVQFVSARMNMGIPRYVGDEREKSDRDIKILRDRFTTNGKSPLAPSTINCWIDCSMKFYYKYVCGFKEPKEILDGIDYALLGTVLHETAKTIYTPFIRQVVSTEIVKHLKSRRQENRELIRKLICDICFNDPNAILTGSSLVMSDMVEMFLYRIFDIDEKKAPFTIVDLEGTYSMNLSLPHDNIKIIGKIDRLDEKDGELYLIDYKTGKVEKKGKGLTELFDPNATKHNFVITQILMYCAILYNCNSTKNIHPMIYALRQEVEATSGNISVGKTDIETYNVINDILVSLLTERVSEIFNKDVPFKRIDDSDGCQYCPYVKLCGRESNKSKNE
ncbi:MAG: PD-(D/E)XK nuclease family protein, partial [Bacteroidales bacterium]|nr:PD-(D/E)XK nuclease family protein [Bacteroidales bacterium]